MENNIYYQLAQTECALDRYKAKLFKKNLALIGMAGIAYLFAKVFVVECKKAVDAKKERDELAENAIAGLLASFGCDSQAGCVLYIQYKIAKSMEADERKCRNEKHV